MLNSVIDNNVGNDSYDDAYENDIGPVDIPLLPDRLGLRRSSSWCRSGHFAWQVMFTDCCQKFGCLGYQLFTFNHFILQFFAVLKIAGVLFLPLLVIINGLNRQVGDEEVDIGLNLDQLLLKVQDIEGWIEEVILLGQSLQEIYSSTDGS